MTWGLGFRNWDCGLRVDDLGLRMYGVYILSQGLGLGFRVWGKGLGFREWV